MSWFLVALAVLVLVLLGLLLAKAWVGINDYSTRRWK